MKARQFRRLAGVSPRMRRDLLVEGLGVIADNVRSLAHELELCAQAGAHRSARLAYNAGREEAGKFLILIDLYRAQGSDSSSVSNQVRRCTDHLAKLLYAQMADYRIGSRQQLAAALERHRQAFYLDGPLDFDYIFRNDLLAGREDAMYVDLVEVAGERVDDDGELVWWGPRREYGMGPPVPRSMRLVTAIARSGLISDVGLESLREAWSDFDPEADSDFADWYARTMHAMELLVDASEGDEAPVAASSRTIADMWPMPLMAMDLTEIKRSVEEMTAKREAEYEAFMRRELGY